MNERMVILKEVGICVDKFCGQTKEMGKIAAEAFGETKHPMRSLENIANSARKVSDVLNYIKRQTGKSDKGKKWKHDGFGEKLLKFIEDTCLKERDRICKNLNVSDATRLDVYLMLIREFIRQMVVYYEYKSGK
jgi:hypothetical protein